MNSFDRKCNDFVFSIAVGANLGAEGALGGSFSSKREGRDYTDNATEKVFQLPPHMLQCVSTNIFYQFIKI